HREVSRVGAVDDSADVSAGQAICLREAGRISHQASRNRKLSYEVHARKRMARSQRDDLIPPANKGWVWQEDKCADSLAAQFFERNFKFVLAANIYYVGAEPEHSCRVLHVSLVTLRIGVRGVDKDTNRTDR